MEAQASGYQDALATQDVDATVAARNALWETLYRLHKQLYAMDTEWNALAPAMAPTDR